MLSCGFLDTLTVLCNFTHKGAVLVQIVFLIIFLDETEGSLIRNCRDCSCTVDVELAEEDFSVFVSLRLIFTAEVEVNIRHLVAVEAEEDRKRNIVSVLLHTSTALGAVFIFKVIAAVDCTVSNELTVSTFRTVPMRWQWIDLSNAQHRRNEAGADTATRAYYIAISVGLLDEAFCYHIERCEAVSNDRLDLLLQPCTYNLRQSIAINTPRL